MGLAITPASAEELAPWRERRRAETPAPLGGDGVHQREGWSLSYLLREDGAAVGYATVLVGHIWKGQRLICAYYVDPSHRRKSAELFSALAAAIQATGIRGRTDDPQLAPFLAQLDRDLWIEKLLFVDRTVTGFPAPNCRFRPLPKEETCRVFEHKREPVGNWALVRGEEVVATGSCPSRSDIRFGELSYEVAQPFRRQGLGSYLVQELKRVAREAGAIPTACCDPDNEASRRTLLRAGFAVCGDLRSARLP